MQKLLREERGFTLIELVMVIVVLGILAAVAIPKFTDLRSNARLSAESGVLGAVRGGIASAHAESLMSAATHEWPASLETSGETSTVFEAVLEQGISTSDGWSVASDTVYTNSGTGNTYTYHPSTGAILQD